MNKFLLIVLVVALLLGGFYFYSQNQMTNTGDDPVVSEEGNEDVLPIESNLTFSGTLPCASCPGIETSIVFMDRGDGMGGAFSMVEVYLEEEDGIFESTGQWEIETRELSDGEEAEVYVLTSEEIEDFEERSYEVIDEDTIRPLDQDGNRIDSELPYNLERQ